MGQNGFLIIGKVVGVHGVKGTVKVHSYAESLPLFRSQSVIQIKTPTGKECEYEIQWAKPHARTMLLALKGIVDRNQADSLIGSEVRVDKKCLPPPGEGEYYWFDIIGLSVYTDTDRYLGKVKAIIPTGSNDVYVVQDEKHQKGKEILIPALESVVQSIDLEQRIMRVDLPEGLE